MQVALRYGYEINLNESMETMGTCPALYMKKIIPEQPTELPRFVHPRCLGICFTFLAWQFCEADIVGGNLAAWLVQFGFHWVTGSLSPSREMPLHVIWLWLKESLHCTWTDQINKCLC